MIYVGVRGFFQRRSVLKFDLDCKNSCTEFILVFKKLLTSLFIKLLLVLNWCNIIDNMTSLRLDTWYMYELLPNLIKWKHSNGIPFTYLWNIYKYHLPPYSDMYWINMLSIYIYTEKSVHIKSEEKNVLKWPRWSM